MMGLRTRQGVGREQGHEQQRPASVAVVPTRAQEVFVAVKYAANHNIELTAVCGSHLTAGASSTNGGLLIDPRRKMTKVDVDVSKTLSKVEGGYNLGHVDLASVKDSLVIVSGTVIDAGAGGQ